MPNLGIINDHVSLRRVMLSEQTILSYHPSLSPGRSVLGEYFSDHVGVIENIVVPHRDELEQWSVRD